MHAITPILAAALMLGPAAPPPPPTAQARAEALTAEAQTAYEAEDYQAASDALRRAFELDPNPKLLYARAQAERKDGDCRTALELYRQYLDTGPEEAAASRTRHAIVECLRELPAEDPDGDPQTGPQPEPDDPTVAPGVAEPQGRADEPPRPWHRDPAGMTLLVGGVAVAGLGVGLLGAGANLIGRAPSAGAHRDFSDQNQTGRTLSVAGGVVTPIGALLAIGGAIRLGLVARKNKRSGQSQAARPVDTLAVGGAADGRGFSLSARLRF